MEDGVSHVRCSACDGTGLQEREPFTYRTCLGTVLEGRSWVSILVQYDDAVREGYSQTPLLARFKYLVTGRLPHGQEEE